MFNVAQWIIVFAVLLAAVSYMAWRIYGTLKGHNDPCKGCCGCSQKDRKQRNPATCDKKPSKKFGQTE